MNPNRNRRKKRARNGSNAAPPPRPSTIRRGCEMYFKFGVAIHVTKLVKYTTLQGDYVGFNTGNGEKLSYSQAESGIIIRVVHTE